jgi:SAM-dependent methyltransferase
MMSGRPASLASPRLLGQHGIERGLLREPLVERRARQIHREPAIFRTRASDAQFDAESGAVSRLACIIGRSARGARVIGCRASARTTRRERAMSDFIRKAYAGEATTTSDWNEYLLEAHKAAPGMTSRLFGTYTNEFGVTSYGMLLATLDERCSGPITLVDLACGDGYLLSLAAARLGQGSELIGVDMSASELEAAERRLKGLGVRLIQGKAQDLSLPDASVDVVLSHLAFMLMEPVEPVALAIARVLRRGGVFSAVVSCPEPNVKNAGLRGFVHREIRAFYREQFPNIDQMVWGDPRTNKPEGLAELFNPKTGFEERIAIEDFMVRVGSSPEDIWGFYESNYPIVTMGEDKRLALQRRIIDATRRARAEGEMSPLLYPLRKFTVVRAI